MKKKILGGLAILSIAVVAAFNVNVNVQNEGFSEVSLENVEALAYSENNGGSGSKYYVNPCGKHPGNECATRKSPYTCSKSSGC